MPDDKGGEKQEEQETNKTNTATECKLRKTNHGNTSINFKKVGIMFYLNCLSKRNIDLDT